MRFPAKKIIQKFREQFFSIEINTVQTEIDTSTSSVKFTKPLINSRVILDVASLSDTLGENVENKQLVRDTTSGIIYQLLESATDTQTLNDVDKNPISWAGTGAGVDDELIKVAADGKTASRTGMTITDQEFNLKNVKPGFNIGNKGEQTGAYNFSIFAFTHYKITLIGDVAVTFTDIPTLQSFTISIQVVQDATGGRDLTFAAPGITFINTQEFDFSEGGANEECYVTMRFYDGKCRFLVDKYV